MRIRKTKRERMVKTLSSTQPEKEPSRPQGLLAYWGWLITKTHTEPMEFFLSVLSLWFFVIVFGVSLLPREEWSATVEGMNAVAPIRNWALLLLIGAVSKLIGLAFRVVVLRLMGLMISVGFWFALSAVMASIFWISPVWGGYVIIGLASAWAFVRVVWKTSDPVALWLRGRLENRGYHVRRDKHE